MKKNRSGSIVFSFFMASFALFFIGFGIYFDTLSKPKNIVGIGLHSLSDEFDRYIFDDLVNIFISDSFSVNSDIDFNLETEYYQKRLNEEENIKKYNLIKNFDKMSTNIVLQQDNKKKKLYFEIDQDIDKEKILNYKYYVTNSTEYYFVNGVVDNYVNNGNGNYFECLSEENTLRSNIDYLYDFILDSFIDSLDDSYFEKRSVIENIGGKDINVNRVSIRLTNGNVRKMLNDTLKKIKKDDKANKILSSVYKDFSNYKLKDDVKFFDKKEYYTINIYTTKYLYKPLKYKIDYLHGEVTKSYVYEGDSIKGDFYYAENDKVRNTFSYTNDGNIVKVNIADGYGKNVGEFKMDYDKNGLNINYVYDDGLKKHDFVYSSKNSDVKKNGYKNTKSLVFKVLEDKESKVSGSIVMNTLVDDNAHIDQDIDSALLASKLTDIQNERINNLYNSTKERLER